MTSKRALDLVIGIPAAVLLTPIIGAIALTVVATSGWPAFTVQTRVGTGERPIKVIKFRTMRVGVPVVAKHLLEPRAEIYTPIGPALRRWSLDELPQIVNVLEGSMSLVGPRPALPSQEDLLTLRRRYGITDLMPGITGLAQVEGRESLTLSTKVRFEALYRRRRSVLMDLWIIGWTARTLVTGRGAY